MASWLRLRSALLGLALVGLLAAVVLFRQPVSTLVPLPLPPSIGARDSVPVAGGKYLFYPRSGSVIQGVVYRFRLYTHCGLDNSVSFDFDGGFWDPIGTTATSDGSGNPPEGFGNPYDDGTIQLFSHDHAEYRSESGVIVRLMRYPGTDRPSYICS